MKNLNEEYYVMNVDGASNHPILAWGSTDESPFLKAEKIDEAEVDIPMQIVFDEPYLKKYEMPDLLMLSGNFASSEKFKNVFQEAEIYGIQFLPVEITTNKGLLIKGFNAIHFWNRLAAIDKDNYDGDSVDRFGTIPNLRKFSLDAKLLESIPLEERLVFLLREDGSMIIVHKSVVEMIQSASLTGMRFWKVSEWDDNAMFS